MARHLIQNAATGDTRIVGDAALPFFPGYVIKDTLEDGQPPFLFYSGGESDLRYVNVSELSDPESAASVALRAASVAAVQDAIEDGEIEVGAAPSLVKPLSVGKLVTATAPPTAGQALSPFFCRWGFVNGPVGVSDLRLYFAQWSMTGGDNLIGNDGILKVAVEYNGVAYPAYPINGSSRTLTIPDGTLGGVFCPGLDLPPFATAFVRTLSTGAKFARGDLKGSVAGTSYGSTDVVDGTGNAGLSDLVGGGGVNPVIITGTLWGDVTTVAILGDSIAEGFGDTVNNRGFIRAALGTAFPNLNMGTPSERASHYTATGFRRRALMAGFDVAIEQYGINDIGSGTTQAALEALRLSIWTGAQVRGCRVYATTITPRTTSTDSWATTGNQTVSGQESVRAAHNTWLRAGAPIDPTTKARVAVGTSGAVLTNVYNPTTGAKTVTASGVGHPLTGVFDPAALVETTVNSGIWKVGLTGDGLHLNAAGAVAAAVAIRTEVLAA